MMKNALFALLSLLFLIIDHAGDAPLRKQNKHEHNWAAGHKNNKNNRWAGQNLKKSLSWKT